MRHGPSPFSSPLSPPSPSQPKQLRVDYTVTGFQGNLRLKVGIKDDKLVAGLELGFPPAVPPDYI